MPMKRFLIASLTLLTLALPVSAQNLFAPALYVNDRVITRYEVDQRMKLLEVLRSPGDLEKLAVERLIEDRLRLDAAALLGVTVSEEETLAGMTEFAGRANLELEPFLAELAKDDVARETFRDFVQAGLAWREVVAIKFGALAQVTESEIDRALALSSQKGGVQVLLSEIILPMNPQSARQTQELADQIAALTSYAAFGASARQYSASPTRVNGGELDWMPLSNLPERIRPLIIGLAPTQVTAPVPIPNALALFQMRGIRESLTPTPKSVSVEYATYLIPGGRSPEALARAKSIAAKVDTCDDLYGINFGQAETNLEIQSVPVNDVPRDIALELAKLDDGEISTRLTRNDGQVLVFLMLCGRTVATDAETTRDDIRASLANQRINSYAEGYLDELVADAILRFP